MVVKYIYRLTEYTFDCYQREENIHMRITQCQACGRSTNRASSIKVALTESAITVCPDCEKDYFSRGCFRYVPGEGWGYIKYTPQIQVNTSVTNLYQVTATTEEQFLEVLKFVQKHDLRIISYDLPEVEVLLPEHVAVDWHVLDDPRFIRRRHMLSISKNYLRKKGVL